jgi:hypothetical protein
MGQLESQAYRGRLSPSQVESYQKEGFIIYDQPVFPEKKFEGLKAHFEKKLAALPDDVLPEGMDVPHFADPALFEWLFADEVLDLVEPILGPDITLFSSHFICKPRGTGKRVPWHEDSYYWRGLLDPMDVATVWLAIDPATTENGCMYVVPQSHRDVQRKRHTKSREYQNTDLAENVFPEEIKKKEFDEQQAVPCVLQPNHASLHEAHTIHGSAPNVSNLRRCGYTMRFMKSSTRMDPEKRDIHNLYLARGKNHGVNPLADPTRSYPDLFDPRNSYKRVH